MGILDGKIALITGAGQGVGAGIALALARRGAVIATAGRTESKLVRTCAAITEIGGHAQPVVCDVSDGSQIQDTVQRTVALFGGVDILINNANSTALGRLLDIEPELLEKAYATGPLAALRLMQACHPLMKARGGGAIINMVSSAAVRWDTSNYGAYASAKKRCARLPVPQPANGARTVSG